MRLTKINTANKPDSHEQKPFPLETRWLSRTKLAFSPQPTSLPLSFMLMKWKTHLVLTTTGPIHSPIQLWMAGCSHSAPQSAAYILEKQNQINILLSQYVYLSCMLWKVDESSVMPFSHSNVHCTCEVLHMTWNDMKAGILSKLLHASSSTIRQGWFSKIFLSVAQHSSTFWKIAFSVSDLYTEYEATA